MTEKVVVNEVTGSEIKPARVNDYQDRLLDVAVLAERFNVSNRTIWRLVAQGALPPPVKIGRCARWFLADITAFEQSLLRVREANNGGRNK
jgi:predicted DNA-binding transcriptional regulator AlpA